MKIEKIEKQLTDICEQIYEAIQQHGPSEKLPDPIADRIIERLERDGCDLYDSVRKIKSLARRYLPEENEKERESTK